MCVRLDARRSRRNQYAGIPASFAVSIVGARGNDAKQSGTQISNHEMLMTSSNASLHAPGPRLLHLDGLRALAVAFVVLFHVQMPGFGAGYLGVDLFFLLSGFLMSWTMLTDRQRHGRFRVRAFYIRRIRRILPSLALTILISLVGAFLLFSPEQLMDTARQATASLLFYSNFFFYDQAGYFAPENEARALLHVWSLSVEEQFYLLFGLLLVAGNRVRFGLLLFVAAGASLILLATGYWTMVSPEMELMPFTAAEKANDALFFLPQYRIGQFAAGALCGWASFHNLIPRWRMFPVVAVALAIGAYASISLMPEIAAWSSALVIVFFTGLLFPNPVIARFGEIAPTRWLARISYQVYMVHWPLIVFWRHWTFRELGPVEMVALSVVSVVGGWLLFRLVSGRASGDRKAWPYAVAIGFTVFASFGLIELALKTDGGTFRIPAARQWATPTQMREMESAYCAGTDLDAGEQLGGKAGEPLITCERSGRGSHVYVWGDSHARHLLPGVAEAFPDATVDILYFTSCLPQSGIGDYVYDFEGRKVLADGCVARNRQALAMFEAMAPTTIILSQYAGYGGDDSDVFINASRVLIDRLEAAGHSVTWLGAVPYPDRDLGECSAVPATISNARLGQRCKGSKVAFEAIAKRNTERTHRFPDVYVDITSQFCPDGTYSSCEWVADGKPLFRDKHHMTVEKSISTVRAIRDRIGRPGTPAG